MKDISIILASTTSGGIGYKNSLPWCIPEELKKFKEITSKVNNIKKKNCVIMGKNTWYSIPNAPLKNRINIVISNNEYEKLKREINNDDVNVVNSFQDAINFVNRNDIIESAFIIGGSQLYNECLSKHIGKIKYIYMSLIVDRNYICDSFVNTQLIYNNFDINKDDININDKYINMMGINKNYPEIIDEPVD
tara:strand:+ start:1019 stop:1594 length:576 start_codon:yes stop_codon:yes gene_type:complete